MTGRPKTRPSGGPFRDLPPGSGRHFVDALAIGGNVGFKSDTCRDATDEGASALCHKATFTSLLDGMDSGTAVSYSPFSGRIQMERRLAAILAADVVGYSRLIRADEEGTLARLNPHFPNELMI